MLRPTSRIPTHPGVILREEYLLPLNMSAEAFARYIGLPADVIKALIREERPVDPELAWLLAMAIGTTPELWMNLQVNHDLAIHRPSRELAPLAR